VQVLDVEARKSRFRATYQKGFPGLILWVAAAGDGGVMGVGDDETAKGTPAKKTRVGRVQASRRAYDDCYGAVVRPADDTGVVGGVVLEGVVVAAVVDVGECLRGGHDNLHFASSTDQSCLASLCPELKANLQEVVLFQWLLTCPNDPSWVEGHRWQSQTSM